jgi:hypothetical protein
MTEVSSSDGRLIIAADAWRIGGYGSDHFVQTFTMALPTVGQIPSYAGGPNLEWIDQSGIGGVNGVFINTAPTQTATATGTDAASLGNRTTNEGANALVLGTESRILALTDAQATNAVALQSAILLTNNATAQYSLTAFGPGIQVAGNTDADNNFLAGTGTEIQQTNTGAVSKDFSNNFLFGQAYLSSPSNTADGNAMDHNILMGSRAYAFPSLNTVPRACEGNVSLGHGDVPRVYLAAVGETILNRNEIGAQSNVLANYGSLLGDGTLEDGSAAALAANGEIIYEVCKFSTITPQPVTYGGTTAATSTLPVGIVALSGQTAASTMQTVTVSNIRVGPQGIVRLACVPLSSTVPFNWPLICFVSRSVPGVEFDISFYSLGGASVGTPYIYYECLYPTPLDPGLRVKVKESKEETIPPPPPPPPVPVPKITTVVKPPPIVAKPWWAA